MRFDIITIFPRIFGSYSVRGAEQGSAGLAGSYFNESVLRRAQEKKLIEINVCDLRDFTSDAHKTTDDRPFGGGPGMIFKIEPIYRAVKEICKKNRTSFCHSGLDPESRTLDSRFPSFAKSFGRARRGNDKKEKERKKNHKRIILFSAKGKIMTQADIRRWTKYNQLILICGRYEGVDERVAKNIANEEISVGKYVLTGGEIPAMIVVDAVSRLVSGVLGKEESLQEESFGNENYLEYPQYTRPEEFNGWKVPRVLLSGNHKEIEEWRKNKSKVKIQKSKLQVKIQK